MKRLRGTERRLWRLRVGNWRVIFGRSDSERVIDVLTIRPHGEGTRTFLAALRRRGHEPQLTRVIAEVAGSDPRFAGALAQILVGKAPERENVPLGEVPAELRCSAEEPMWDREALQGYVDLLFQTESRDFALLVELKLHSNYGYEQVQRYLKARDWLIAGDPHARVGLVAVTRNVPAYGEPTAGEPGWLGSVRWARILDQLLELEHEDEEVTRLWRALLDILNEQGDLGVTKIHRSAIEGWAKYASGRDQLEQLLQELADGALEVVRTAVADSSAAVSHEERAELAHGQKGRRVVTHQSSVHLPILIPATGQERLRIQFMPYESEGPYFSVQAMHENARELPDHVQDNLRRIERNLKKEWSLDSVGDLTDHTTYWAHVYGLEKWLDDAGPDVADRLLGYIKDDVELLVGTGIFSTENGLCEAGSSTGGQAGRAPDTN